MGGVGPRVASVDCVRFDGETLEETIDRDAPVIEDDDDDDDGDVDGKCEDEDDNRDAVEEFA